MSAPLARKPIVVDSDTLIPQTWIGKGTVVPKMSTKGDILAFRRDILKQMRVLWVSHMI